MKRLCVVILLITIPAAAYPFLDIIKSVLNIAQRGTLTLTLASEIAEVSAYPGEYVRAFNIITSEINTVKHTARKLNLDTKSQNAVADMANDITTGLNTSLRMFDGLLTEMKIISQEILSSESAAQIPQAIARIKEQHIKNLERLYTIRGQVRALHMAVQHEAATNKFLDNVGNAKIYE